MPSSDEYAIYTQSVGGQRISTISVGTNNKFNMTNRFSQKYDSCSMLISGGTVGRRRLSSTGEGSGDSSTTTSGSSSYGEREDGSEGSKETDELEEKDEEEEAPTLDGKVTETEKQQVETFFRGLKTEVFVSGSLANLYTKTSSTPDWDLKYTGIPVVLLDHGEARARDKRRIQIMLAERGTCFMLWKDTIDNLTSYKVAGNAFHTMCYSIDHSLQIGLSFDNAHAAQEMWNHIEKLVSCPENIQLSMPGKKKKKKDKKPSKPAPLPPKSHISQPCCFQHVTRVDQEDHDRFFSLKEFVPKSSFGSQRL
ncbi:uncharacterized protein [Onthophagus taurus]|uniref:uncharacterized protein n=1 Tax=Onthophagus taurus TaxID=166361 RepID=UPI000C20EA14|nr:uncharacterized protein LOC111415732 [Onthophagus taurus]